MALPREKLLQIIAGMLESKGPIMEQELQRRVAAGEGLQVKTITMDVDMLEEALKNHSRKHENSQPSSLGSPTNASSPEQSSGKRWAPAEFNHGPKRKSASARWTPGAASASLLAAKALSECEAAECFPRHVQLVDNAKVAVLPKPNVLAEPTGEYIQDTGEGVEVVARYVSPRDGRVYLRLRIQNGWASTRSRKNFSKIVLAPRTGEDPIEPRSCTEPIESPAFKILPTIDAETIEIVPVEENDLDAAGEDDDEVGVDEPADDEEMAALDKRLKELDAELAELDGEVDGDEEVPDEETTADYLRELAEEDAAEVEADAAEAATASSAPREKSHVRRFKVMLNRCPILRAPSAAHLTASGNTMMRLKEEFLADGAVFIAAEQRTYLRLTRGRGWVCEQARNELRRKAVVPMTKRKHPISKKLARVIAFRGGDTDGVCKMRQEDLVKNKRGKIVSKKASEAAKKKFAEGGASKWTDAVSKARMEMGVTGFSSIKKGTPLYEKAQEHYKASGGGAPKANASPSKAPTS